ncbi:MAG: hypothetical protein WCF52_10300, partial [Pseudolabrys sp.]
MIELLLRSDLAVEFTEFKIVLPRAAVFLAGSHPVGLSPRRPECPLMTQSGHRGKPSPFQRVNVGAYDA